MKTSLVLLLSGLCLLLLTATATISAEAIADDLKTLAASRVTGEIRLDGTLNEPAWHRGQFARGFRQLEPAEGEPATESTLVKIIYDDAAVYVGFWCYDSEPERTARLLTRRDRWSESDQVSVRLDTHHDHQTAYYFNINAAGVVRDLLLYNNTNIDESWDAVWEADVSTTPWGWSAEFRIPYSALRFPVAEEYEWGLDFSRYIPRNNETDRWQFVPSHESGGVGRYGHLAGIKGIEPGGRLEAMPYFVSYGISEPRSRYSLDGKDFIGNAGVDIKYGLSSSLTIDAAINPDFGQVESDNAIINLDTYETYFSEKRPFFLEGNEIFQTPYFEQFYSRRIGRAPYVGMDEGDTALQYPRNTTILSAVKLTGKTTSGTAIGVMNVVTQEEKVRYRSAADDNATIQEVVEPLATYTVARLKQDVGGSSYVGGMFTSANQDERTDAFTGSADCRIYMLDQAIRFSSMVVGSNNGPGTSGIAAYADLQKVSGKVHRGNIMADYYDDKVDLNRLGYLSRNDYWGVSTWQQLRSNKEFGPFHYLRLNFNGWYNEHNDGQRFWNGGNINGNIGFTNNWWVYTGYAVRGSEYDDRETRGSGLWKRPGRHNWWLSGNTNSAKKVCVELHAEGGTIREGDFSQYSVWVNLNPATNVQLSVGAGYELFDNARYWVGETSFDESPVFGRLDGNELDINLRGTYTFNRDLTLQWYTQFYFSTGTYDEFSTLVGEDGYESISVEDVDFGRSDYNYKSLRMNLILRWQYLPGSALYAVWTQNRDAYHTGYGDFDFSRDWDDLFATPQTNTFLIKANYWWNI